MAGQLAATDFGNTCKCGTTRKKVWSVGSPFSCTDPWKYGSPGGVGGRHLATVPQGVVGDRLPWGGAGRRGGGGEGSICATAHSLYRSHLNLSSFGWRSKLEAGYAIFDLHIFRLVSDVWALP